MASFENRHSHIIESCFGNKKILTMPTHGRYQGNWEPLPYDFYMLNTKGGPRWNLENTPRLPKNHHIIASVEDKNFSAALSQSKFGQFQALSPLARIWNIPLISLEHTVPLPHMTKKTLDKMKKLRGDKNVFIGKRQMEAWGFDEGEIIHHGVNTDYWKPGDFETRGISILTVANEYRVRGDILGFKDWEVVDKNFHTTPVGHTPGLSEHADDKKLLNYYQKCGIFLNTSKYSPVPTSVLEAMACGCVVISTKTYEMQDFIVDKENGLFYSDTSDLIDTINSVLSDPSMSKRLGENARKTIEEKFSLSQHLQKWEELFNSIL